MGGELVAMSTRELDRLAVVKQVLEGRITRVRAAELMGLGPRQVSRLCDGYERDGPAGLVSRKRGRPSNRKIGTSTEAQVVDLVRAYYEDFGPTLVREKLLERHGLNLCVETVRKILLRAGIWLPRDQRAPKPHQPRFRRACLGELVQIDGSEHAWFEDRGPRTELLVVGLRRRRDRAADGAPLRPLRIGLQLLRCDGFVPARPRQAGDLLQRQTQHLPRVAREGASEGARNGVNIGTAVVERDTEVVDPVSRDANERAIWWADWAVAATIQVNEGSTGPISSGANDLFDANVAVFASNGNFTGSARAPANAHKALGVGQYDVNDGTVLQYNKGTSDGRHKPDIIAPSRIETASAKSASGTSFCDSCLKVYGGTSCAGPVATAAASVLRHFLIDNELPADPGHVYAGMIAFGDRRPNDDTGAGKVSLGQPTCARWMVGQVEVGNQQNVDLPFTVGAGESDIRAAIWWPEESSHRDVDLYIIDPSGNNAGWSNGVPTVFERDSVNGSIATGSWKLRIRGYSVPFGTQTVYYVLHNKKPC